MRRHVFHVVFFQDRGWWVAQCLEHNLTASSKDPQELQRKLAAVLKVQAEVDIEAGRVPFSAVPPAPRRFWKLFQSAEPWGLDDSTTELPTHAPAWTELALVA
jgi:hypothetical protein